MKTYEIENLEVKDLERGEFSWTKVYTSVPSLEFLAGLPEPVTGSAKHHAFVKGGCRS